VRFDDRLATVLSQPVGSPHDRAVRWRQLVDLVARSNGQADRALLGQAIELIRSDQPSIREPIRAAAARSIAGSPIPLALLMVFAADKLAVAAPLIATAALTNDAMTDLRAAASPDVRRFLDSLARGADAEPAPDGPSRRERQPEREPEPEPELEAQPPPEPEPEPEPEPGPSLSDVVARVEQARQSRQAPPPPPPPAPLPQSAPLADQQRGPDLPVPALFRWECGAGGDIEWVEGAPRGPLIGRSIAVADADEGVDDCVERAFVIRAPFRDCLLELGDDGLMAGEWQISGAPAFAPGDGRFIGYRGIARRGQPEADPLPVRDPGTSPSGHDALREMIHEIKTPLNAIIGFAEIIDGQYFGPAHRRYRERAAEIVSNARSLLEAAEDLDFVARLQSARAQASEGTDLARFFPGFATSILERAAALGVELRIDATDVTGTCLLEPELTERLLRRFSDAILAACVAGEQLTFRVRRSGDRIGIELTRPKATILARKEDLLDPEFTIGGADRALLGLGFSLRLINGLVAIAGGELAIDDAHFTLSVPLKGDGPGVPTQASA
jgi:hypothetical protein